MTMVTVPVTVGSGSSMRVAVVLGATSVAVPVIPTAAMRMAVTSVLEDEDADEVDDEAEDGDDQ